MQVVTAQPGWGSFLIPLTDEAEIRDADGSVIGYFTPRAVAERKRHEQARALFDPAEGNRRAETESARPLAEILQDLQNKETAK
jgi:hypothetical protein